jgi:hypothetical protein
MRETGTENFRRAWRPWVLASGLSAIRGRTPPPRTQADADGRTGTGGIRADPDPVLNMRGRHPFRHWWRGIMLGSGEQPIPRKLPLLNLPLSRHSGRLDLSQPRSRRRIAEYENTVPLQDCRDPTQRRLDASSIL